MGTLKTYLALCLVGIVCGLLALCMSWVADRAFELLQICPWLVWTLPLVGLATYALYRAAKVDFRLGTRTVVQLARDGEKIPAPLCPLIMLGTCLTIFAGGSVGKEAAALQLGASASCTLRRWLHLPEERRQLFALAGMGSAFAVLLGTPLAATVFAVELVGWHKETLKCLPGVLLAVIFSTALFYLLGADHLITPVAVPAFNAVSVPALVLLLVAGCVAAVVFCLLLGLQGRLKDWSARRQIILLVVGGLLLAAFLWFYGTDFSGTGMLRIQQVLVSQDPGSFYFLGKLLFTAAILLVGFKGGDIMPLMCIGATLGAAIAQLCGQDVVFFSALGLILALAAATNCPFAMMLMGIELFGFGGTGFYIVFALLGAVLTARFSLYDNRQLYDFVVRMRSREDAEGEAAFEAAAAAVLGDAPASDAADAPQADTGPDTPEAADLDDTADPEDPDAP